MTIKEKFENTSSFLVKRNLFDSDRNPKGTGIKHKYELKNNSEIVIDKATGLVWQFSGSINGMNYKNAINYINGINDKHYSGFNDWRLPTLEEAMSLMETDMINTILYINPIFDHNQWWIWTADKVNENLVWVVSFASGTCKKSSIFVTDKFVRAVRTSDLENPPFKLRSQPIYNLQEMDLITKESKIFISYSHKDAKWLEYLKIHLKPIIRNTNLEIWDDSKIGIGKDWREEINIAIESSKVAILLVTPNFLSSDIIYENELDPLLKASEKSGLVILWIAVSASSFKKTKLEKLQALNDPATPLDTLNVNRRNEELIKICEKIEKAYFS